LRTPCRSSRCIPEALATGDAVGYLREEESAQREEDAYKVLYPAYGTYLGGSFSEYVAPYTWVYLAGVIPGHIVGRWKATTVEERRAGEQEVTGPVIGDQ
jgi:hypothetical protein